MTQATRLRHVEIVSKIFGGYMTATINGQLAQPGGMVDIPAAITIARDATLAHLAEMNSWITGTIPGD